MRKTLSVLAMTLALACSAHAGNIPNMITGELEPPPPSTESTTEPTGGVMPNGQAEAITQVALNLLQNALSLF
jgi:hypothetical protein